MINSSGACSASGGSALSTVPSSSSPPVSLPLPSGPPPLAGAGAAAVNMPCSDLLNISLSLDKSILSAAPELVNEIYLMNKGMNQCLGTLKLSLTLQPAATAAAVTPTVCGTPSTPTTPNSLHPHPHSQSAAALSTPPSAGVCSADKQQKSSLTYSTSNNNRSHTHDVTGNRSHSSSSSSCEQTTSLHNSNNNNTTSNHSSTCSSSSGTSNSTSSAEQHNHTQQQQQAQQPQRKFSSTAQTQDGNLPLRKRSALRPPPTPVSPPTTSATCPISPPDHPSGNNNHCSTTTAHAQSAVLPSPQQQQEDSCKRRRKISIFERRPSVIVNGMHPTQSDIASGQPCGTGAGGLASPVSSHFGSSLKDESAPHNSGGSHDLKRKCSLFNSSEFSPECLESTRKISAVSLSGISFNPDDEFDSLDEMEHDNEVDHVRHKKHSIGQRRHVESDSELTMHHGHHQQQQQQHMKIKEEPHDSAAKCRLGGSECSPDHLKVSPTATGGRGLVGGAHHVVAGPPLAPHDTLNDLDKNYQLHGGPHRPHPVAPPPPHPPHPGSSFYHPPPLLHVSQMSLPAASVCSPCSVASNRSTPPDLAAAAANSVIPQQTPPSQQTPPDGGPVGGSGGGGHRRSVTQPPGMAGVVAPSGSSVGGRGAANQYYPNSPIAPLANSYRTLNSAGSVAAASGGGPSRMATCDLCPYQAKHPYQIKLHKRNCHSDERPYQCNFCWYASKQRCNLNRHVRQVHRNASSSSLSGNTSASAVSAAANIPSGSSAASNVPAGALMGVPLPRASGYFGLPIGSGRNPAGAPPSHGVFHSLAKR